MPKVSVVIPTYNRRDRLARAIRSVLDQTHRDLELIVVDDASTDETEGVVKSFTDERITYLRHEVNRGAPAARNTGLRKASGEFIALLDSDNEWLPRKLEKQLAMFQQVAPAVGVIYANNRVVDELKGTETVWAFGLKGSLYRELLQRPFMDFITPLMRRECFDRIGPMDEKVPAYQEWDTFIRISKYYEFDFVPEVLAVYHIHSHNRISAGRLADAIGWDFVFHKHRPEMMEQFSPRVCIEHHRNLARLYRQGHVYGRMMTNLVQAWRYRMSR